MPNPYGAPEITPQEVADKLDRQEPFVLLDVRERHELENASFPEGTFVLAPLSELVERRFDALPAAAKQKDAEIVVFCHHGIRSAQVTAWLLQEGWTDVLNLAGGIDAYAKEVDPEVGMY